MNNFGEALVYLFKDEGVKYTNDPLDPGGPTKWGITQKSYSSFAGRTITAADIAALSFEDASYFYRFQFWNPLKCDEMKSAIIAVALFDCSVLFGLVTTVGFAQQVLSSLALIIRIDGEMGDRTLQGLNNVDPNLFVEGLYELLIHRIGVIVEEHPSEAKFKDGWTNRAKRLLTLNDNPSITLKT